MWGLLLWRDGISGTVLFGKAKHFLLHWGNNTDSTKLCLGFMKFINKENYFDRFSHTLYKLHIKKCHKSVEKNALFWHLYFWGNWIAYDDAKKILERGISAFGLNTGNHYSFQGTKDLFKQILFQMCIYERKVAHDPSLSKPTNSDGDVTEWNWRNKPFQQVFPLGAPYRSCTWRAGEREGRGCRSETFLKGCVVTSGRRNRCVSKVPSCLHTWVSFLH